MSFLFYYILIVRWCTLLTANNYWFTFLCFMVVIVIILLYPVINLPMVNAVERMLDFIPKCNNENLRVEINVTSNSNASDGNGNNMNNYNYCAVVGNYLVLHRRYIISIVGVFLVILIDVSVPDLPDLFGLTVSLGLSFVCYIFPCVIHLIANWKNGKCYTCVFWFNLFICLLFVVMMIYSTFIIIQNIINKR